ncbi:hypothetical protein [Aurantimonas sp. Leaf443]|uniref:hypothetical protein n=1 Tax=Aurantimonas sp. Leaf443 TaxID=1736378 RepID=UPI0006F21390|nr:hypothetical protein [Aurantimonas sp. Leaf443]KQT82826.1 hypothetical protein ASG48_15170 [Aurantimonas sp. Leaf443]
MTDRAAAASPISAPRPSPRGARHRAGLVAGALLGTAAGTAANDATLPSLRIEVVGEERLLFDHGREACETWDVPDTPTRAFRDADGLVHVFQTHHRNRAATGPSLLKARHDCAVVFEGKDERDPASFDNLGWIAATHTLDGRTVHALVHNEFRGARTGQCPSSDAMACWYNTLTAAVSHDGGRSFAPQEPRLVAALPLRADETRGGHAGYFEPTNILSRDGAFYVFANVVSPPPQRPGNCLLRSDRLEDAGAWRGWRNGGFTTRFADPYAERPPAVEAQLCDPVSPGALPWPVTSLTLHEPSGITVALMKGRRTGTDGVERTGVFYATSRDLISWEGPALLLEAPIAGDCEPQEPIAYPALVDPKSADRNFGTAGDTPLLTFVRIRPDGCALTPDRDVVMRETRIVPAPR